MPGGRYRSPSTGKHVRAVLFDTFGTVVDWRTGIADAVAGFLSTHGIPRSPAEFASAWRAEYQPSMQRVRSGERAFVPLDVLHRENLETVLSRDGFDVTSYSETDLETLALSWHRLPAWPDSVAGLHALKAGHIIGPLSNGNTALLVDMAKFAGLPWDVVLGSDISRAYKPDPRAYRAPAEVLGLEPGEMMLVAAHNADLDAAQQAGLATGFVARPHEHGPNQSTDLAPTGVWDVSAATITGIADRLRS